MSQRNERSTQPDMDGMTHWLIHHAAHRAPESLSARLEEEWLADLEYRSSAVSKLRFALGCCWAAAVIVYECPRNAVAAASPAAASRGFITLDDRNFGYFSLRSATLFLIAGLHAALFYGLITTVTHTHVLPTPPNLQNRLLKAMPPERLTTSAAGIDIKDWNLDVQKPVVDVPRNIDIDSDEPAQVPDQSAVSQTTPIPVEAPPHVVRQVAGGPGAGFPETAAFFPPPSIRLGEEGLSTVQVCVDTQGRLTSDPSIVKGSGIARLDTAALKLARAGSGHYRATTDDGRPVNSCYPMGIRFQLRK
jgi:TonB family protein